MNRRKRVFTLLVFDTGLLVIALFALLGSNSLPMVRADSFTVTKFSDSNDGACDADCSLREAIIAANGNGQADSIILGAGTYTLTLEGTSEDAASTGDLDIVDDLTLTGLGADHTYIDANDVDRVLDIYDATVVISGVTIMNGYVPIGGSDAEGGGIRTAGDLTLINTRVSQNWSHVAPGGGVYVSSGNVTMTGGEIVDNTSSGNADFSGSGGGVFVEEGKVMLTEVSIDDNEALCGGGPECSGGGVYIRSGSVTLNKGQIINNTAFEDGGGVYVYLKDATFLQTGDTSSIAHNTADNGGGIYVRRGQATLSGGQVYSNTAKFDDPPYLSGNGGGIYVRSDGAFFQDGANSTIVDNAADDSGGGVYLAGNMTLSAGQILSNASGSGGSAWGGGIYVGGAFTQTGASTIAYNTSNGGAGVYASGDVNLNGGQILSNTAKQDGGGIRVYRGDVVLNGGKVFSNTADHGGGVYLDDEAAFTQTGASLIAYNTAYDGAGLYLESESASATLKAGQIFNNTAWDEGGGICVWKGHATLHEVSILNNRANNGGGLYRDDTGAITVTNSCIVNNSDTSVVRAGTATLIATSNWWGAADGPSGAGPGNGDSVSAGVDVSDFLTTAPPGCPSRTVLSSRVHLPLVVCSRSSTPPLAEVYILDNDFHYVDNIDYLHIVGDVQNSTDDDLQFVEITVNIFDSGGQLLATDFTYTPLGNLPAGEKTCFDISLEEPANWDHYEFEAPTYWTTGRPLPNLSLLNDSGAYDEALGWYELTGQVRNDHGDRVEDIMPVGTLYNATGRVIGCEFTYIDGSHLDPDQESAFEITFSGRDYSDVTSYRIQVDGEPK